MPTVTKQTKMQRPTGDDGSIIGRAVPVSQVHSDHLAITVYGQNRVGKTTFACTFPKPLLLISFEPADCGGAESVTNVPGVKFLKLGNREDFLTLCDELKSGVVCDLPGPWCGKPYESKVLDTGTSLQDKILCGILGLEKLPEQIGFGVVGKEQYMARADQVKESLRTFLGVPGNRVILNQEKDHRPRVGEDVSMTPRFVAGLQLSSFISADLGGGNTGWLRDACPYVCRLYLADVEDELPDGQRLAGSLRRERRLLLQLQMNFDAGFRVPTNVEVPDYITIGKTDGYVKLIKAIRGEPIVQPRKLVKQGG